MDQSTYSRYMTVLLCMLELCLVEALTVERNVYKYYKIPATMDNSNRSQTTIDFNILQCSNKAREILDIPAAKDIPLCVIVGNYKMELRRAHKNHPVYSPNLNRKDEPKFQRMQKLADKVYNNKAQKLNNMSYMANQGNLPLQGMHNCKKRAHCDGALLQFPPNYEVKEIAASKRRQREEDKGESMSSSTENRSIKIVENNQEKSVNKTVEKLKNYQPSLLEFNHYRGAVQTENNFAEQIKRNKGNQLSGYHNMYYRDETFKDHIFYDDVVDDGRFKVFGKSHEYYKRK